MQEQSPNTKTDKLIQGASHTPHIAWTQAEIDLLATITEKRVPASVMRALFPNRTVDAAKRKLHDVRNGIRKETVIGNKPGDPDPDPQTLDPDDEGVGCSYNTDWRAGARKSNKIFLARLRELGMAA